MEPTQGYFSGALMNQPESKFKRHSDFMTNMLEEFKRNQTGPLHDYQIAAVLEVKRLVLEDEADRIQRLNHMLPEPETKPILIVAPTGSGKSGMIVLLPYIMKSERVLILTPSKTITDQLNQSFGADARHKCFFEKIGLVSSDPVQKQIQLENILESVTVIAGSDDINKRSCNLAIVNAQKFGGRSKMSLVYNNADIIKDVESFFKKFDTLIVDEAHYYPAKTWENIVNEFSKRSTGPPKKIVFLTATPYKTIGGKPVFILDRFGEEAHQRIAYQITPETVQGITTRRCEFLEPYDGHSAHVYADLMNIFVQNLQREPRISLPKAMILVRRKGDANALVSFLNTKAQRDDFAIATLGGMPDALDKFSKENYQVAVTCGVGKEGYDNPDVVACVILCKIVNGRILFNQFVGRCMRLNRRLGGNIPDQSIGVILSYPEFNQKRLWNERETLAEEDPLEVDEDGVFNG